jgi:uncharacterized membrane protein YoaK (UPF0700 family)
LPPPHILEHLSGARRIKAVVALFLTFAAGYVDIVGFIRIAHTFTAHMTGNTIHLAHRLAGNEWHKADLALAALLAFVAGSVIGRCIIEAGARRGFRRIASFALALECILIIVPIGLTWSSVPSGVTLDIIILLAAAMGLQTATLTRIGPLTIHTTFVTGMINKLAQLISHSLFLGWDTYIRHLPRRSEAAKSVHEALYIFSIWLMYFCGGIVGAMLAHKTGLRSLLLPLAILVAAILVDQFQPLSLQEEREELSQPA